MGFRNFTIGARMMAGFAMVILIGLLSALINNHSIDKASSVTRQVKEQNFPYALLAEEMAYHTEEVQQFLTDVSATRDPEAFKEADEAAVNFRAGIAKFKAMYSEKNDQAAVRDLERLEKEFDSFYEQGKLMARAYLEEGTAAGNRVMRDFDRNSEIITAKIRVFKEGQRAEAVKVLQNLVDSLAVTRMLLWFLALCVVVTGALVGWLITRSITRPLVDAVSFAKDVAQGDFSRTIEVKGGGEIEELNEALNAMAEGLNGMVAKIRASSGGLARVSGDIFEVSQRLTGAAAVQANGVQDTSSAILQISDSIKSLAEGVDVLAGSAAESSASTMEMAASIEEVALNVETLATSAEQVSASITETAAAVRQIDGSAATLKDTYTRAVVSVAQMDGSIRQVEQNARAAAAISGEVLSDAETGKAAVEATGVGIDRIRRASTITAEVIATLSVRAKEIGAILSVIDEVAGQTNLLALNAAIIAAQAGEHGKGFAVVAEQIKELANRTSNSTREIGDVIRGVQDETHRAVEAIDEAEKSIEGGELLSQQSGEALEKIVAGMKRASGQVAEIAGATVEQARGSQMIRQAMEQVADMVDQIARATGEQRKGSELISVEVERMRGLTSQVKFSTHEQTKTGNVLAQSSADITEMVRQVKAVCDEQSRGSEQIVRAVQEIRDSAGINLDAARVMDEAVTAMLAQVDVLKSGMDAFREKGQGGRP